MITKGDGPSGEIRTPGVLNPNQVPYQLGHTRISVGHYTPSGGKKQPENAYSQIWGNAAQLRLRVSAAFSPHFFSLKNGKYCAAVAGVSRLTDAAYPLRVYTGFLRFWNLRLVKNLSLTALADWIRAPPGLPWQDSPNGLYLTWPQGDFDVPVTY